MNIVLYTQRVEVLEAYNERRDCADQRISKFIKAAGYLPIPLPNNLEIVEELVKKLKPVGIILTGGNSLSKYGGNAPEKDLIDKMLIDISIQKKIPLYGFCRGMQSILDYFGNELNDIDNHVGNRHAIYGEKGTTKVNSYHKQGCISLKNKDLSILMVAEDGVIEMIKHNFFPIIGTMWHPEREEPFQEEDIKLLNNLIGGEKI